MPIGEGNDSIVVGIVPPIVSSPHIRNDFIRSTVKNSGKVSKSSVLVVIGNFYKAHKV